MVKLPEKFLEWNYFARRKIVQEILEKRIKDPTKFFLEFTRHNPALCTAAEENGRIVVNGKIVGIGYIPKKEYLKNYIEIFEKHIENSDKIFEKIKNNNIKLKELYDQHAKRGLKLLLEYMYLKREEALEKINFEKLATIELAKRIPYSSKHTWNLIQKNRYVCLLFFQPPAISFEIKGYATIYENGDYHKLVNLIHDCYHYTPPEKRKNRPVYIIDVLEVYDNSATKSGFGTKIA